MKLKFIFFVIFIVLANSNSYGQKTYYGYQQRENSFDKTKEKLRGIVLTLNQDDRSIQVNLLGELVSYKAGLGDDIAKDYTNKLVKIGPLDLYYDYEKRVTKFGKNELKYSYGKMTQIGKYEVLYDYTGEFSGTKEILETSRPWW